MSGVSLHDAPRLGKYELIERIGEGGFGVVYRGFDPFIKRAVAVKTCTSPSSELRQRYFREAEIAGKLDHPNIVRIFDFGIEDDTPYLVQEFLPGVDLDDKIREHEFLPYPERLLYLIHVARGLEYAHAQGVIHRDIKPANIRILEDGTAKIMDFGVAVLQHADTRLTQAGTTVGTAAYLAPEQVRGKQADQRTDIFSFGVLAYELFSGERPFEQDNISATLFSILNDDPRSITLPASVFPESLRQLIHRCLQKDPANRFSGFDEILGELDRVRRQMRLLRDGRDISAELRRRSPSAVAVEHTAESAAGTRGAASRQTPRFDPPLRPEWSPPSIRMVRRRRWGRVALPLGILALAAVGYAWVSVDAGDWRAVLPFAANRAAEKAETDSAGSGSGASTPTAALGGAEAVSLQHPASEDPGPAEAGEQHSVAVDPSLEAEAVSETPALEAASEPPVVEDAVVRLVKSWHPQMTVNIDGSERIDLSLSHSRKLAPGDHTLTFALQTQDYRAVRSVRIRLEPGEERIITTPIAPPGELSVQASLGSPQGMVSIDGTMTGMSPLRSHHLAPGRHTLRIYALDDTTRPLAESEVDIRSRRETVVTFDLTGTRELAVRYRDLEP